MISTDASVACIWHGAPFSLPSPTHLNSAARTIVHNYTAAWHQGDDSVGIAEGLRSHSSSSSVMLSNEQLLSVMALYELAAWPDLKALGSQMKHPRCAFLIGLMQLPRKHMIIAHAVWGLSFSALTHKEEDYSESNSRFSVLFNIDLSSNQAEANLHKRCTGNKHQSFRATLNGV